MQFTDRMTMDGGLRRTADGYAVVSARVARGGNVQTYLGSELGITDKVLVRVYRPESEVFKKDAIASYAGVPITIGHPDGKVTADSWKDLAVGETGEEVLRDGEFVRVPMMLRDAKGIDTVESGTVELSMGYDAMVTLGDGVSPAGEPYDASMSGFKMNHVAIVDKARGGDKLRIGDGVNTWGAAPIPPNTDKEPRTMSDALRTVVVDGLSVSTTDQGAQAIAVLQQRIADAATKASETATSHATIIAAKDKDIATRDAQIDDLKAKVLDAAAIDKLVADRAALIGKAKVLAKDVKTDGLSDADIRKAVVVAVIGDAAKDKSATYIDARFDILVEDAVKKAGDTDPFRDVVRDGLTPTADDLKPVNDARAAMLQDLVSGGVKASA